MPARSLDEPQGTIAITLTAAQAAALVDAIAAAWAASNIDGKRAFGPLNVLSNTLIAELTALREEATR